MLNLTQKGVAGVAVAAAVAVMAGASVGTPMAVDSFADQQPDSALYGLEKAGERIKEATYAGGQEWQLERAEERTQEFKKMAKENKGSKYKGLTEEANERLQKATQKAKTNRELRRAENAMRKHISVLENVKEKVPEQAKPAISLAISRSAQGQATVASMATGDNNERLREETREKIRNRMREIEKEAKKMRDQVRENLEQGASSNQVVQNIELGTARKLGKKAQEAAGENKGEVAAQIAEEANNRIRAATETVEDNKGLTRAIKATQKHVQVLENVREKVPEVAKPAISLAIQQSSKQRKVLENVAENGVGPGETIQKKVKNQIKERMSEIAENHRQEMKKLGKQMKEIGEDAKNEIENLVEKYQGEKDQDESGENEENDEKGGPMNHP